MNGIVLKRQRQALGLTVTGMAEKLQLPRGTYVKYEFNQRPIPKEVIWHIAFLLKDHEAITKEIIEKAKEFGWEEKDLYILTDRLNGQAASGCLS